ncbi:MAG: anti-sigma factor family protein [Treponema sp.]
MYTCPGDDIHSIYVDGELPDVFVKEYESHVASCADCAHKLERLRKVRRIFKSDSDTLTLDKIAMEESFSRLNTKLRYSHNTARVSEFPKRATAFGGIAAAAAAAVFALVVPARITVEKTAVVAVPEVASVLVPQVSIPERNVVITGNIGRDFTQNVSSGRHSDFTQGDFFRPEFSDDNRLYIRIAAPGAIFDADSSDVIGMNFPMNTVPAYLK